MARGHLRIYLGASPGVGKTFAMLDEGWRRKERGTDVVIGIVETHGRPRTAEQLRDLEVIPRRRTIHRGAELTEMDVDAVLARKPELALVDELAHTNAPGSRNEKRWQDVAELLDAGIDVISTVNVQHLESLNDVVARITGVTQGETVPDAFVRTADQVELVDMTPEALRRRMAHGNIYPAERIDAALANFFKLGNLAALREMALLWVADRVEEAIEAFAATEGVDTAWELRERIVVGIAGAPSAEMLLRRAARIASRARADLIAVRVVRSDGLAGADASQLADARRLVTELGGQYHEVVGDDVIGALLTFARAERATQLIVGASPLPRWRPWFVQSFVSRLVARSGRLDVHVISVEGEEAASRAASTRPSAPSRRHPWWIWPLAALAPVLLTLALLPLRDALNLSTEVLAFLGLTIATAVLGGRRPAMLATGSGFLLLNWFFTPPVGTFTVGEPENVVTLVFFVVVTLVVGSYVDRAAMRARDASRARAESEALARSSAAFVETDDPLPILLEHVRTTFGFARVAVRECATGRVVHASEGAGSGPSSVVTPLASSAASAAPRHELVVEGPLLTADQRRVLDVLADHVSVAVENRATRAEAARASELEGVDEARTALLRSVSHDLRTPLAAVKAFVSGLRDPSIEWSPSDRQEIYAGIESETDRLDRLVANLLDASRLEAGALAVQLVPTPIEDPVAAAIRSLGPSAAGVSVSVEAGLEPVLTDPALLERAIANVISNAVRHAPDSPVHVDAARVGGCVAIRVVDHGRGIPPQQRRAVLEPFQRLSDNDATSVGIGLGLAITSGIVRVLGGRLELDDTPGGGLTASIELPVQGPGEATRQTSRARS